MPSRRTRRARGGSFQGQKPTFGSPMVNKPEGGATSFTVYSLGGDPRIPGTKSFEELMARCRRLRKWCKNSCIIFKAYDVHTALGIEEEEPQCNYGTGSRVEEPKFATSLQGCHRVVHDIGCLSDASAAGTKGEEPLCNCETSNKLEVPNIATSRSPPQEVLDAIHHLNNAFGANRAAGSPVHKRTEIEVWRSCTFLIAALRVNKRTKLDPPRVVYIL